MPFNMQNTYTPFIGPHKSLITEFTQNLESCHLNHIQAWKRHWVLFLNYGSSTQILSFYRPVKLKGKDVHPHKPNIQWQKRHIIIPVYFSVQKGQTCKVQMNLKLAILKFNGKYGDVLIMSEGPRVIYSKIIRDSTDPPAEDY